MPRFESSAARTPEDGSQNEARRKKELQQKRGNALFRLSDHKNEPVELAEEDYEVVEPAANDEKEGSVARGLQKRSGLTKKREEILHRLNQSDDEVLELQDGDYEVIDPSELDRGNRTEHVASRSIPTAPRPATESPSEKVQIRSKKAVVEQKKEEDFADEERSWFSSYGKKREKSPVQNPFSEDEPGTALVRDKKTGRVTSLRADERFITLKEAYQYIADRRLALNQELEAYQKSGVMSKEKRRELEKEQRELDRLQKESENAYESDAAKVARYSGSSFLIENPLFREEDEAHTLQEGDYEVETVSEESPEEEQRKELDELYRKRNEITRMRDVMMQELKYGDATTEMEIGSKRVGAAKLGQQVQYPNYFPADIPKEMKRQKLVQEADEMDETLRQRRGSQQVVRKSHIAKQWELGTVQGKLANLKSQDTASYPEHPTLKEAEKKRAAEIQRLTAEEKRLAAELAPHQRANIGEALREVLDELDDIQEAIIKQERNVQFLEKRHRE